MSNNAFIDDFFKRYGEAVTLIAVSKTKPADQIREVFATGVRHFGENYLQEALDKMAMLKDLPITWHFIGPLQSNKTKPVAESFDWVHSVDRLKLAERLSAQRPASRRDLNILIQVNVSGEASKSGLVPEELASLARAIKDLPHIRLRGLMAIPEPTDDSALLRARFGHLRQLLLHLNQDLGLELDTLSMGMSSDYAIAIEEGSTQVRIGTAIFGARTYPPSGDQ